MRALASLVLGLWLTLLCGCWPGSSPPDQKILKAQLRGLTLREAVQQLGLKPEDCALFDEPPGVARGIQAKLPDGRMVHLWLARQDGLFRENRDWTFQQIADRRVADVKVEVTH
jgi:hypothetical protein